MIVVLIIALAVAVAATAIIGTMYQKEKRTAIVLNHQLDLSYKAFVKQRLKLHEMTAENEELKCREERIKDFCRGASTVNKQAVPWEAD